MRGFDLIFSYYCDLQSRQDMLAPFHPWGADAAEYCKLAGIDQ